MTEFTAGHGVWSVATTLKHDDAGWKHYADAWRVVDERGHVLGERKLWHPHDEEQPFTRDLNDLAIPESVDVVYVEAHDNVHGWSPQRVRVDLRTTLGPRYRVSR